MHPSTLTSRIETTAPLQLAASWDKCGVQIASAASEIRTLCVALDPSVETVRRAVEHEADFLLCHHPLSLAPRLPSRLDDFHEVLSLSLKNSMWLYSAHTSLDANPHGPVNWLGRALGMQDMRILEVTRRETPSLLRLADPAMQERVRNFADSVTRRDGQMEEYLLWPEESSAFKAKLQTGTPWQEIALAAPIREYGFGCIGTLPETLVWNEFTARLTALGLPLSRMVGQVPETVARVAYCPGSGADLGPAAFAQGADVYLTGDVKYHQAQAVQDVGLTIDVGHFCLEETMMRTWSQSLDRELSPEGVRVIFLQGRDPFA
ncbi:dinuclear metal center protein, YbgI/SA1388 family [Desulfomicrobium apsheronum]|uniref:GTP cyclohydrolase 1 type 2 homolog n=1 Tax=Desulfomicrobium apsheronum TaxID=52560 RepID=A0A1I3T9S4_9BACT|nr:Nif3-like dinuclear metal center hexameric protein [Desulfomicrobium apsheronum]SFJ66416.1 dinuclear metal center protein, YbgI/SA1388 family [Desulfomicrobium apsheronum]